MSARVVSDAPVMELLSVAPDSSPAPARRMLDVVSRSGVRVLALAEPLSPRRAHGREVVRYAMLAVERVIAATDEPDPVKLLERAFNDANEAVFVRNRQLAGFDPQRRAFVGLAMAGIAADRLVIALAPPGQTLVIQDGIPTAFPPAAGSFEHASGVETSSTLGMFARCPPAIFETRAAVDDLLALGGRGLAAFLDTGAIAAVISGPLVALEDRLDDALTSATGVGDLLCGRIGDSTLATPHVSATKERGVPPAMTLGVLLAPVAIVPRRAVLDNDLPAVRFDQWHTKVIEASERWFARKDPPPAPINPDERAAAAIGGGCVRRYQPHHRFSPGVRSIMPRYSQAPWRTIVMALVAAIILGGLGFGYNIRQARASKQVSYLTIVQRQYDQATSAAPPIAGLEFVVAAENALHAAERNGASAALTTPWEGRLNTLRDSLQGTHRFSSFAAAGLLPRDIEGGSHLVEAGGSLFVIAGSVFQVNADGSHLATLLAPGTKVGGRTAGQIQNGSADGAELVVSDGKTLFRWTAAGKWTAEAMPATSGSGWLSAIHGAYLGNYYLLDLTRSQILKFARGQIGTGPASWLDPADLDKIKGAIDMALDSAIHVLLADGSIETLYMGKERSRVVVSYEPNVATEIGLASGADPTHLYVLERGKLATRLIRYNAATGQRTQFQVAGPGQAGYTEAAVHAFGAATDFAVDESSGKVSFLSEDTLWVAALGG